MQPGYFGDAGGPLQGCGITGGGIGQPPVNASSLYNDRQWAAALKASQPSVESSGHPSTEIESCLSRANNALERLHSRITAVEDRVRPVMRTVGTGQNGSAGKPQEALSPLGDAITGIESRIDSACDRLEALLAGLAL